MLNFLCFEARGHTFSGKSLVRRPVPVDSEGSSDELERMGGEGGEMIWVKVKETSQKKIYLPTSIISTKQVVSWFWVGVEFFLSVS